MEHAISLKNEALNLVENGQEATERMDAIISELAEIISSGKSTTVARACLNRVASAL